MSKIKLGSFKGVRNLALCALAIALYVVLQSVSIDITPDNRLTFAFVALALAGYLLGAIPAFFVGALGNLLGWLLKPTGALHPGIMLTAALTGALFGLILYRQELKVWRIAVSRALVNIFLNCAFNTIWLAQLYGDAYFVMLPARLIKNLVLLPIEIIILFVVLKLVGLATKQIRRAP